MKMITGTQDKDTALVKVEDLRLGLFVTDLRLSWFSHSFVRSSFRIDTLALLNELRSVGKGHEVSVALPFPAETPELKGPVLDSLQIATVFDTRRVARLGVGSPVAVKGFVSLEKEMTRVKGLVIDANKLICSIMQERQDSPQVSVADIRDISQEMVASTLRNPGALQSLTMLKSADDYSFTHSVAVGTFMISLGRKLGLSTDELELAGTAGLLLDVGKAVVDKAALPSSGPLSAAEKAHAQKHTIRGEQLLIAAGYTDGRLLDAVRHHHERIDGKGYPDALAGTSMGLFARMGAVVDVYDAVTSYRSYGEVMPPTAALQMLKRGIGSQFDATVVAAFLQAVGVYPNGSLVKLASGKLAVVKEQSPNDLKSPKVRVFFSIASGSPVGAYDLELSRKTDAIVSFEDPVHWKLSPARLTEHLRLVYQD